MDNDATEFRRVLVRQSLRAATLVSVIGFAVFASAGCPVWVTVAASCAAASAAHLVFEVCTALVFVLETERAFVRDGGRKPAVRPPRMLRIARLACEQTVWSLVRQAGFIRRIARAAVRLIGRA